MTPTRDKILESAKKMLAEQGFNDISMQQIADDVEVSKAALYHFFPAKEDIYVAVMQELLMEALDLTDSISRGETSPENQFRELIHEHLKFGLKNRTILQFWDLAVQNIQKEKREDLCELHRQLKSKMMDVFERNQVPQPEMAVMVFMSSLLRFLKTSSHPDAPSSESFADYLVKLFLAS